MILLRSLAVFALAALATPSDADIFGWLKRQKTDISCAPLDRDCIIAETVDMVFSNAAKREVAQNTDSKARQLADLAAMMPQAEAEALRARVVAANDDPSFLKNYDRYRTKTIPAPDTPLADLRALLEAGPEGNDSYGRATLSGFTAAIDRGDTSQAIELWVKYGDDLWKRGGRAYELVQNWMARHDTANFTKYTNRYSLFRRSKQKTYQRLGQIAVVHCASTNAVAGREVLKTVQAQFDAYEWEDPVIALYAQSELYAATLHCHGLPLANTLMTKIERMAADARAFVMQTYPKESEQAFVLEAMHDTVELRTWRVLAYYQYIQLDDRDAARVAFERGKATQGVYGIGINADGALVPQPENRETFPFETFERDVEAYQRYHPSPFAALRHFLQNYEIATLEAFAQNGYYVPRHLFDYADHIEKVWPDPLATEASAKAMRIAAEISQADPDYPMVVDLVALRLGTLPQPANCALPEARIAHILNALPDYRFGDSRVNTALLVLRYLDREQTAEGPCAIPQNAR